MSFHNYHLFFISDASSRVCFLTLPGSLLQVTHDRRTQLFQLLLLQHLKLKNEFVAAESESIKREERHAVELGKLQNKMKESAKVQELLTDELEKSMSAKSTVDKQLETAVKALKERAQQDEELKTKQAEDKAKREKAESDLAELQSQCAGWFDKLKLINRHMSGKFPRVA